MYIRQEILLSFEEIEKFSPPTKLELILSQIDLSEIILKIESQDVRTGPKGYCKRAMLYAVIARIVEKIPTVKRYVTGCGMTYVSGTTVVLIFTNHHLRKRLFPGLCSR